MNALPGRCAGCGARVFWIANAWRNGTTPQWHPHICGKPVQGLPRNTRSGYNGSDRGDAQTPPGQASPAITGADNA